MFETQEQSTYSLMPPSRQAKETHQTPAARQPTRHTASAAASSTSSSSSSAGRHGSDGGGSGTKKRQRKRSFHETLESLDASDDDIYDDDDDLLDEAYGGGFDSNEYEASDMLLDTPGGIDVDSLPKAGGGQHTASTPPPRRPSSSSSTTAAAFTQFTVRDFSSDDPSHRPLKRKRGRKSKEEKERELLQLASAKKDITAPSATATTTTGFVFEPPSAHFSPVSPSSSPTTAGGGGFSVGTGLSGKDRRRKGRRSTLWTPEDDAKFLRAYRMVPFARNRLNDADVIIN
jgi:hypothetical protein